MSCEQIRLLSPLNAMPADDAVFTTANQRRPVRARHAASLIVWRREVDDTAVLMGMRGARHRFMPSKLVFPGGAVDPADEKAPFATAIAPATRAALERSANPTVAQALASAATRELAEETGLTLGRPPKLDALCYLCRAVTPPDLPIRYNARFFTIAAEHVSGTLAGDGELENLRFYSLGELHAFDLAWITREVLTVFERWLQSTETERLARTAFPVCRRQRWATE